MADEAGFLTIHVVKERIMGANYHPAFNWYGLLIFAAVVIGLVTWARRRRTTENDSGETSEGDSQWFVIARAIQPEVHDSPNSLITAFKYAFEQAMGMSVFPQLLNLEVALKALPYQQVPQRLLFPEPLTAINCDASGESWDRIARGHTLMLVSYPDREEDERAPRYSEIEESGVLDRPRKLLFSVHYAGLPFAHSQWGFSQVVVLVPVVDSDDFLQNTNPVFLVVEVSSSDEDPATAE